MTLLKILLALVLAVAALIAVVIAMNAPANVKAMNEACSIMLEDIRKHAKVTEKNCGEYSAMTVKGVMKFRIKQWEVEGIGNLSSMIVNMGLMQMMTMVLTPADKDLPLVSVDYMYILGNRKAYIELYDLVLDKSQEYRNMLAEVAGIRRKRDHLETFEPSSAWYDSIRTEGIYKKGTKADDAELNRMLDETINAIMNYSDTLGVLTGEERTEKIRLQKVYSNGLIDNGGISTDVFVQSMGKEKTREFFDHVLFKAE